MDTYFYSPSSGLYVSLSPLKIDSRVKITAQKIGVELDWDDEGNINFIDFDDTKKLLSALGSRLLSPVEYWQVMIDAVKVGDQIVIDSLTSDKFCEWIDRTYLKTGFYIDHPHHLGKYRYSGKLPPAQEPLGRPGWFDWPNNINPATGCPRSVSTIRNKFSQLWKYWSPDFTVTKLSALVPISDRYPVN